MIAEGLLEPVDGHCVWLWCFRMEKYKKSFRKITRKFCFYEKMPIFAFPKPKMVGSYNG